MWSRHFTSRRLPQRGKKVCVHTDMHVHHSFICSSQILELKCSLTDEWVNNLWYIHTVGSSLKEWTMIHYIDRSWNNYMDRKKSGKWECVLIALLVPFILNTKMQTNLQRSKQMIARPGWGVRSPGILLDRYVHYLNLDFREIQRFRNTNFTL